METGGGSVRSIYQIPQGKGEGVVVGTGDNRIVLVSHSGAVVPLVDAPCGNVTAIAPHPTSKLILIGSADRL